MPLGALPFSQGRSCVGGRPLWRPWPWTPWPLAQQQHSAGGSNRSRALLRRVDRGGRCGSRASAHVVAAHVVAAPLDAPAVGTPPGSRARAQQPAEGLSARGLASETSVRSQRDTAASREARPLPGARAAGGYGPAEAQQRPAPSPAGVAEGADASHTAHVRRDGSGGEAARCAELEGDAGAARPASAGSNGASHAETHIGKQRLAGDGNGCGAGPAQAAEWGQLALREAQGHRLTLRAGEAERSEGTVGPLEPAVGALGAGEPCPDQLSRQAWAAPDGEPARPGTQAPSEATSGLLEAGEASPTAGPGQVEESSTEQGRAVCGEAGRAPESSSAAGTPEPSQSAGPSGRWAGLSGAEQLRRQRISDANRGRRAWNTGRSHSEGARRPSVGACVCMKLICRPLVTGLHLKWRLAWYQCSLDVMFVLGGRPRYLAHQELLAG